MEILTIVEKLVKNLEENPVIDVGRGTEGFIGCTRKELNLALREMERSGYYYGTLIINQVGSDEKSYIETLGRKGMTAIDVWKGRHEITPAK